MTRSLTPGEHQLISMDASYWAENYVREVQQINSEADIENLKTNMVKEYRRYLNDESINLVEGVPQHWKDTAMVGIKKLKWDSETGFHANAITRGKPDNPEEIVITFTGTDFSEIVDVAQTGVKQDARAIDYSELAIEYVRQVKELYPGAKIVINGHSLGGKLAMQAGVVFPDVDVYAFNPTALDSQLFELLKDGETYDNIKVVIYDKEVAAIERYLQYFPKGTHAKSLPFNYYHIDSTNSTSNLFSHPYRKHNSTIEQHSTGGFRSVDGTLWDVMNIRRIDFAAGVHGTKSILFDKERYLFFANVLLHEFGLYVRRAIELFEQMEEEVHTRISSIVADGEQRIQNVAVESHIDIGDPRVGAIESVRDDFFKGGKYRCYDRHTLDSLLGSLQRLNSRMGEMAQTIWETSHAFETRDIMVAETIATSKERK